MRGWWAGLALASLVVVGSAQGQVGGQRNADASRGLLIELAASHRAAARANPLVHEVLVARSGDAAALAKRVRAAGGRVEAQAGRVLNVSVRRRAVATLGAATARPQGLAVPEAINGEELQKLPIENWQHAGLAGNGTRVAIIDLGFGGLAAAQAAGEVPTSAVTVDFCHGKFAGEKHGTAVAEIVAEEAPAAQLYLLCVDDEATLLQAEQYAIANGVQVINHSVGWFGDWSGNGQGPAGTPDAVANDARAHNILWVNSAGNHAQEHWAGTFTDTNGDKVEDFVPGDEVNGFYAATGDNVCVILRWNEWPSATHDYDLYIYDAATATTLAKSEDDQSTTHGAPVEQACYTNTGAARVLGFAITVYGSAGPAPLDVFVTGASSQLEHQVAAQSITDPAASPNVLAVGATCWQNSYGEPFSSQGPTIDGRIKPDISGFDRMSSFTYGMFDSCSGSGGFAGTSAASPSVAGLAALVRQRYPSYTAAQTFSYLIANAFDFPPAGADNIFGAGQAGLPWIQLPVITYPSPSSSDISWHEATVSTIVDPKDSDTTVTFEYNGSTQVGGGTIPAGAGPTTLSAKLTGLAPNTQYSFRVIVKNLAGTTSSDYQSFQTPVDQPPTVQAGRASGHYRQSVSLPFTLGDDTGDVSTDVDVYAGGTIVRHLTQADVTVSGSTPDSVTWKAPKKPAKAAKYKFCVEATDKDGNSSGASCAGITLR